MSDINEVSISVAKLEVQVEKLEKDMTELKADIKAIRAVLDRADGGWKMFLLIGSIGAGIMAIALKLLGFLKYE